MKKSLLFFALFGIAPLFAQSDEAVLRPLITSNLGKEEFLLKLGELESKVSSLGLLEAKLVYSMRNRDFEYLISLIPDLEEEAAKKPESFVLIDAETFASLRYAAGAQYALSVDNEEDFRNNVMNAWYESPDMGRIYTQWVDDRRKAKKNAALRVPMDKELQTSTGETVTLAKYLKGKKAGILDFWATWCGPCIQTMPDVEPRSKEFAAKDVVWIGLNTEGSPEKASRIQKKYNISTAPWLTEPKGGHYSRLLNIDSIPRTVLFDAEGKIHFDGHPNDPGLDAAVAKLLGE